MFIQKRKNSNSVENFYNQIIRSTQTHTHTHPDAHDIHACTYKDIHNCIHWYINKHGSNDEWMCGLPGRGVTHGSGAIINRDF